MRDELRKVLGQIRKHHERISVLEETDFKHQGRIDKLAGTDAAHESRLDRQHAVIHMLKADVKELGKDVGWSDDMTKTQLAKTQVMFPEAKRDDEPPPDDAA